MEYNKKTAYVWIKTNPGQTRKVWEETKKAAYVIGSWVVTGTYDVLVWVNANSEDEMYTHVMTMRGWNGVTNTRTHAAYSGSVTNWNEMMNPNGAWIRIQMTDYQNAQNQLREYNGVCNWASVPGDYDYFAYVAGKTYAETAQGIITMSEKYNWNTSTHVPAYSYLNPKYNNAF
ncbi:MAG: Lrp/AsnC ligand binding domain-containing protein [Myxococcota bacterium]|jgi:hypothetical protein|nr:Lrp/AsnC ligand binding domain-containing protein [Myxococcota bacterium]